MMSVHNLPQFQKYHCGQCPCVRAFFHVCIWVPTFSSLFVHFTAPLFSVSPSCQFLHSHIFCIAPSPLPVPFSLPPSCVYLNHPLAFLCRNLCNFFEAPHVFLRRVVARAPISSFFPLSACLPACLSQIASRAA